MVKPRSQKAEVAALRYVDSRALTDFEEGCVSITDVNGVPERKFELIKVSRVSTSNFGVVPGSRSSGKYDLSKPQ